MPYFKHLFAIVFFASITSIAFSQQLYHLQVPPPSTNMPAWANVFQQKNQNVYAIDSIYTEFYKKNTFEKNVYTRYYKKWRHAIQPFVRPNGSIDSVAMLKGTEFLYQQNTKIGANNARVAANANWSPIGPSKIVNSDIPAFNISHVNVYYVDIARSNTNIVYCATETGSIYKTTDKGMTWQQVAPLNQIVTTGPIAIHPTNPDIVYIATNNAIIKTTDGGSSWVSIRTNVDMICEDIEIDPTNPNNVYVATSKGLLKSGDAGQSWTFKTTAYVWNVQINQSTPSNVFIFENTANGSKIAKSTDFGENFTTKDTGWHTGNSDGGLISIAASNPAIMYAISLKYDIQKIILMKSTDGGESWTKISEPSTSGQGFYDLILLVNPNDPNQILTGTLGFLRSTDGGVSFSQPEKLVHTDQQQAVAVGNDVWLANDGGLVYSSDFFATAQNSHVRDEGIYDNDFWGFGQGWNVDIMGGGRYHNGNVMMSETNGLTTGFLKGGTEEGTGYVLPNDESRVLFSSNAQGYSKFPDEDGYGFEASELEADPTCYNIHYLGSGNNLWKSTNAGGKFSKVPSDATPFDFGAKVKHFEIFRQNSKIIYVSTYNSLWKTVDGGANWQPVNRPITGTAYTTISLSFRSADTLWANFGNAVYKTTNGGNTWENLTTPTITGNNFRQVIHQAGTNGGVYLLSSPSKVFYRDNTMTDWVDFSTNLPVHFGLLKGIIFYRDNKLRIAGLKGVWETPLYSNSKPLAQMMTNLKTVGCSQKSVAFKSYSVANKNATFEWTFEGGTPATSTDKNPTVLYSALGKYDVTLKITNPDGGVDTQTFTDFIEYSNNDCSINCEKGYALQGGNWGFASMPAPTALGTTNTITMSAWIKPNGNTSSLSQALVFNSMEGFGLAIEPSTNELSAKWKNSKTLSGINLPINQWSHITWVVTPTQAFFYLNGANKISINKNHAATNFVEMASYAPTMGLGWEGFSLPFGQSLSNFQGEIDEVKIYKKALSDTEVLANKNITNPATADLVAYVQFNESDLGQSSNLITKQFFDTKQVGNNTSLKIESTAPVTCVESQCQCDCLESPIIIKR